MISRLTPPLKYHGGKHYLTRDVLALMPPHRHYVEPFAGGLRVLLARDPEDRRLWWADTSSDRGVSEVANDINGWLTNFWRVLRDVDTFEHFRRQVEAIPLSRTEWEQAHAHEYGTDPVADAVAFFVDCRQSLAGRMDTFTGITRTRTRRRMNDNASGWIGAVDGLPAVHARLRRVVIENRPALDVIRKEDEPGTLFYCDPPYLHETRACTDTYAFEMTEQDHADLLDVLQQCKGKVILSGYPNALYDRVLAGWNRDAVDVANHAAGGKQKARETEVLWRNF
jgi:DNA adenine methylase